MIFKVYRVRLILFVFAIILIVASFFYFLFNHELFFVNGLLAILLIYTVSKMIKYVDRINGELTKLFDSIRYSDFSISFPERVKGNGFEELYNSLRFVIEKFKEERKYRVEHFNYMKTIVQHVKVGLIAFDGNGKIELMNLAFKKMFEIRKYNNLRQLGNNIPELLEVLENIKPFEKDNVQIKIGNDNMSLAVSATEFILHQQKYKLISLHDINSELEKKEMEAWEKLIRVITHEIMNSITPISSLASTANSTLTEANSQKSRLSDEDIEDIALAVKTIEKRSVGLLKFVKKYRQVTRMPKPEFADVSVRKIFDEILPVITKNDKFKSVEFKCNKVSQNLIIQADSSMIEQVIINLINNSLQSLENAKNPKLELSSRISFDNKVLIEVKDSGEGISEENLQNIFIPFFTTKKEGSGIGLSLSRQIMRAHNGRLTVNSVPNKETIFTMEF